MKKIALLIILALLISCSSPSVYDSSILSDKVTVSDFRKYYSVIPNCYSMDRAFVFYPGGLVDADAYIPFASRLAEEANIAVFIQKMPFNLAVLGSERANSLLEEYNYIGTWYIGGHSLGGVMAASYINSHPDNFEALVLLASYPMEKKSLNDFTISVLSINGSEDGLVDFEKIDNTKYLLPPGSIFKVIDGANHSQFGSYGFQKGDRKSTISEADQQKQVIAMIRNFIDNL